MSELIYLLAQTPTSQSAGAAPDPFMRMVLPLLLALGVMYWIMMRGQRKERKKQQDMLGAIKRNDRVQTIGGILGTVVDVRDTELVLKVDETSNVKLRFNRAAVKEVIESAPGPTDKGA